MFQLVHQQVVKSAKKCEKNAKKVRKIYEKVQNANAMQKRNQNLHHVALHYYSKKNCIFGSHSHCTAIPVPRISSRNKVTKKG